MQGCVLRPLCAGDPPEQLRVKGRLWRVCPGQGGAVGLAGLEPAASSLSGIEGSALCGAAFPQVARDRQGRRDAFLATSFQAVQAKPGCSMASSGSRIRASIDRVSAGQGRRDERQRQADVALLSSTNRAIHADRSKGHHGLISSFLRIWHLVSAAAAVAELASGHALSYSPLRELAADGTGTGGSTH